MWMQATGLTNKHYNEEAGLFTKTKMDQSCNRVPSIIDLKKTPCKEPGSVHVSIRLKHFRKLFHFYISGNILAFIVFFFEKIYNIMPSISKFSYTCSNWKLRRIIFSDSIKSINCIPIREKKYKFICLQFCLHKVKHPLSTNMYSFETVDHIVQSTYNTLHQQIKHFHAPVLILGGGPQIV